MKRMFLFLFPVMFLPCWMGAQSVPSLAMEGILSAIHEKGSNAAVADVMDRQFVTVNSHMTLDRINRKLHSAGKTVAAVVSDGDLKGLVCLDGIGRYFMVQSAIRSVGIKV